MGGKSGGGFDAGPSIEYGNKALALQERIYDESIGRTQPFYEGGVNAFNMLLDGIGARGGSVQSRDQIYDSLKDQYTTETTAQQQGQQLYLDPEGNITTKAGTGNKMNMYQPHKMYGGDVSQPTITTTTDFDALNAAVDERLAGQETPDNYGHLLETFDMDKFKADPGYQFRLDEGQKALERQAAARGQYYDPSTVKALTDYNSNMADQTYGDAYNRYNNDQNTIFNRLAAVSGIGQTANNSLNQAGQNFSNQASNTYGQIGGAIQSAQNANAAQPSMFDKLLNTGAQIGSAYLMKSDIRMKTDIKKIGVENGHNIYEFKYIGDNTKYSGVMAQEVKRTNPEAVVSINGVLHVDYNRIGVEMREVA